MTEANTGAGSTTGINLASRRWTRSAVCHHFRDWEIDSGGRAYLKLHSERYAFLMNTISSLVAECDSPVNVVDIGPAYQTALLRTDSRLIVDTVGFEDTRFPARPGERHTQFDLNDAQDRRKWPKLGQYDVAIMAEVIEHLYTSPRLVLACVATWLKPGGRLVVQTPNAVALRRRIKLLAGRHPYEMIRDQRTNPGHFREYTANELKRAGRGARLTPGSCSLHTYFQHPGVAGSVYRMVCRLLPGAFQDGITLVLEPAKP